MWETFHKVRNRLTPAEWDQVFMEIRGDKEFDETREAVAEFAAQVKTLVGQPTTHLEDYFNTYALLWQRNMVLQGYMFTYSLDTPDLFYREFTLGGRVYSLLIAFTNGRKNIELRFK